MIGSVAALQSYWGPHFLIQLLDRFNVTFLLKNNVSRTATSPAAAMAPLTVRRIRMTEA
jgi:hypothetical protein